MDILLSLPVESTIQSLIDSNETNENYQITRDELGPKVRSTCNLTLRGQHC